MVWAEIKRLLEPLETILMSIQEQRTEREQSAALLKDRIERTEAHLADIENKQRALLDLYLQSEIAKELLDEKVAEFKQDSRRFKEELDNMNSQLQAMTFEGPDVESMGEYCAFIRGKLDNATFTQK